MLGGKRIQEITDDDLEWMFAEYYFARADTVLTPGAQKLSRTNPYINEEYVKYILTVLELPKLRPDLPEEMIKKHLRLNHSFIEREGEIYSVAEKGAVLGAETFGTIKLITSKEGNELAVKMQISDTIEETRKNKQPTKSEKLKNIEQEEEIMKMLGRYKGELTRVTKRKRDQTELRYKLNELDDTKRLLSNLTDRRISAERIKELKSTIKALEIDIEKLNKPVRKKYTIMEFIKGKTLDGYYAAVTAEDFTPIQKLVLGIKMCQQIEELHEKRILHCDVKSQNIMVDIKGNNITVTSIDFGLSDVFPKGQNIAYDNFVRGTPGFIPPEAWEEGIFVLEFDNFSLGKTFEEFRFDEKYWRGLIHPDYKQRDNLNKTIWNMVNDLEKQPNLDKKTIQFIQQTKIELFIKLLKNSEIVDGSDVKKNWEIRRGPQLVSSVMSKKEAAQTQKNLISRFGKEIFREKEGIVSSRDDPSKYRILFNFTNVNEYLNNHIYEQELVKGPVKKTTVNVKQKENRALPLLSKNKEKQMTDKTKIASKDLHYDGNHQKLRAPKLLK